MLKITMLNLFRGAEAWLPVFAGLDFLGILTPGIKIYIRTFFYKTNLI
jgi:hypothetical protein